MGRIKKAMDDPRSAIAWAFRKTKTMWSDEMYLRILYRLFYGKRLNLKDPIRYSEKMQWLKLYHRKPIFTQMVDKFEVKKIVAEKIGADYVIPCYGVWDSFDDIDFETLPNQFCLKCTHDSGSFVICKDKATFDYASAKEKLERNLNKNFFYEFREWPYKDVKARILAEKYEPSLGNIDSVEYKLTCCNGDVRAITVCGGIPHADFSLRSNDTFTKDWQRQNWYAYYKPKGGDIKKPAQMDEIINLSEKLSNGIPYVRVDWYIIKGKPFFGEFTFYTWAGFLRFMPSNMDEVMGKWIVLPNDTNTTEIAE